MQKGIVNYKIHMRANLSRCPEESADFEKVVMCLIMRMLNRKINKSTISSEIKVKNSEDIADIGLELKDKDIYYELQKNFSKEWQEKIINRDLQTDTVTIPVPLKPLIQKYDSLIKKLKEDLEPYILEER